MNFDSILESIKGMIHPKFTPPLPVVSANEHLGNGLSPVRQKQLDSENAAFLANWNKNSPTPTPAPRAPAETVASVLGVSAGPTNDLWGKFSTAAREQAIARGYNPDVVIKQKALESNFGRSNFAKERNNFGGIGAYDSNPNSAFSFKDIQDYLDYYFKMVEKRYPDAYANRQDPEKYVEGLKKGGYATDPEYVWKVTHTPLNPR